ncbi:MAG TPA: helix-turn-helix transcriptional regulator [Spirochaetota bacterium]|nr:helix-turn-helix transcriptional regulator [Spirochaetota bacterium]
MFFSAVGCLFLIAFAFNDIIDSKGMIKTGQIFHIGLLIFTVFHSIILSKRYAGTYNQKDFLINELETTLKEKIFYKNYASERTNKEKILLDNFSKLTKREKQIIYLLGIGKLEKEIADILEISQNTVKNLKYLLFKKTNVTNKQELLNIYFDKNIQLELLDISKLK